MPKNNLWSHISPFRINKEHFFLQKMVAGGHFGCSKITFFRSIRNIFLDLFTKWLPFRSPINISDISDKYATFICFSNCFSKWPILVTINRHLPPCLGPWLRQIWSWWVFCGQSYGMLKSFPLWVINGVKYEFYMSIGVAITRSTRS